LSVHVVAWWRVQTVVDEASSVVGGVGVLEGHLKPEHLGARAVWRDPHLINTLIKVAVEHGALTETGVGRGLCELITVSCAGFTPAERERKTRVVDLGVRRPPPRPYIHSAAPAAQRMHAAAHMLLRVCHCAYAAVHVPLRVCRYAYAATLVLLRTCRCAYATARMPLHTLETHGHR
jgi:hypothetical protein